MNISWRGRFAVAAVLALVLSQALLAQNVVIKLATVVPDGSIWDKSLKQMGADWSQATGGRVSLTVFSGGAVAHIFAAHP